MNKLIAIVGGVLTLIPVYAHAAAYYCSTGAGNGYINLGDTIAQVQQACGAPTQTQQSEVRQQQTSKVEYWLYQNNEAQASHQSPVATLSQPVGDQPTLGNLQVSTQSQGPNVVFKVENKTISGISRDGINTNIYSACSSGTSVQVGGSIEQLIASCGQPSFINTQDSNTSVSVTPTMVTTWTYDLGGYTAPLVLQFTDGKLVKIN